ncbi:MAG: FAD-dependent oxidoreductase [Bacteroidota bacterium]
MNEKVNIILNGKHVTANKGEFIHKVAQSNGIDIPTLCHDPRLEPYSSCYVCVVEIEGIKGLQPSCSTRVAEGMNIQTESEKVCVARKTAMDLLVSNHYADCIGPCKSKCPAGVDVQGYISLIEKGLYSEAIALIKQDNPLPAICGRVCVRPCEAACRRNLLEEGTGVGIDYMKRFAADQDLLIQNEHYKPVIAPSTGKKIAIIGAGPGGLSAAYFLQQKGHQCDIYEANNKPGGWLRFGIPEYRLPNDVLDKEVERITDLGVNIFYNKKLGENLSYKEVSENYDATILTIGSQRGTLLGCEGEEAEGVFSGIDFLRNMEMTGQRYNFKGKKVIVVGGGNTAMDCCRTSLRCNSTDVKVVYRRTEKEMPANPIEIHESKLEGVEYMFLHNPVMVNKDSDGKLKSVTLLKMGLGEPDSSGRRRPVPIEGSEFDLEVDYILAAIGQKTDINFLADINQYSKNGKLKATKWGDIDADPKTLQTGIPSIFAAGDGVTGPATIIEAVAQAKIASRSCHQFLLNEELSPFPKEFISKKDHFAEQKSDDYVDRYQKQAREEMPTMDPDSRVNFKEVELGYSNEKIAKNEANRCLECGCVEYFTCDLKKYATKYNAEQNHYEGEFKNYQVDFSHPYIEIDNNKCILCSRCIRVCKEIVGANAIGLVNRGFDTYVAPSLGDSLAETTCESCGLCISACPTAAMSENVKFKPGPVMLDTIETIDNYSSEGIEINLHHKGGYIMRATGRSGIINNSGNISRQAKFGYNYYNDNNRITKPLLKKNGEFVEIGFEDAYSIIESKIKSVTPEENIFYAGARLTNEELYLAQKFVRAAVKTNNIASFHYFDREANRYKNNSVKNVPFDQIKGASKFYIIGSELNIDNSFVNFMVFNTSFVNHIPVEVVSTNPESKMLYKASTSLIIKSYYHFIKAINHFILSGELQNQLFINDNVAGFDQYKQNLLIENYNTLINESGVDKKTIEEFAIDYNNEINAVLIFSEKEISSNTSAEIRNLAMITGKLGKTSNGIISLKEKNNSQGLFDMGILPIMGPGQQKIEEQFVNKMESIWKASNLSRTGECQCQNLKAGKHKNIFIFGEDPIGCAVDKSATNSWLGKSEFLLVQDLFMTETAEKADLILPASLHIETGGSFTNTQRVIRNFDKKIDSKVEKTVPEQFIDLLNKFGVSGISNIWEAFEEAVKLFPAENKDNLELLHTQSDNNQRWFKYGCDYIVKQFEEEFKNAFTNK